MELPQQSRQDTILWRRVNFPNELGARIRVQDRRRAFLTPRYGRQPAGYSDVHEIRVSWRKRSGNFLRTLTLGPATS